MLRRGNGPHPPFGHLLPGGEGGGLQLSPGERSDARPGEGLGLGGNASVHGFSGLCLEGPDDRVQDYLRVLEDLEVPNLRTRMPCLLRNSATDLVLAVTALGVVLPSVKFHGQLLSMAV